jgi:putative intracellular protease/amidase
MEKILAVVASTSILPNGAPTGFWLEELAAPYLRFTAAGYQVDIASVPGGAVNHDPSSEQEAFVTEDGRALLADASIWAKLQKTLSVASVNVADYAAVFLVGGVPAAFDFDAKPALNNLLNTFIERGKVVSAVCHGVIGLTTLRTKKGVLAAEGHPMTGFSYAEEVALDLLPVVAAVPEERLTMIGASYRKAAEPFGVCVAEGPLFITGQNPASAGAAADAVLTRLRKA